MTPALTGARVLLRAPMPKDAQDRYALGRDPDIVRMFGGDAASAREPMTEAAAQRWVDRIAAEPHSWVIEAEGRAIGSARLHSFDEHDRSARYAIGILDPAQLGRGLGTEVTQLVLRYAFEDLDLHRVDLRVIEFNERAIGMYRACGFVEEGRERESARVDGVYYDDVIMSILEQEFRR